MKLKRKHNFFAVTCSLMILFIMVPMACNDPELAKNRNELERKTAELKRLQVENQTLKQKNSQLEKAVQTLSIEKEMLVAKQSEWDQWSQKIIANHGAGIWYLDEFTLPVFVKPMPGATATDIIRELNLRYAKDQLPKLILKKLSDTSVTIGVDNVNFLTQQMGTSGATSYIQSAFFSITSIAGIDCVHFEFKEGDHAIPGKYCR